MVRFIYRFDDLCPTMNWRIWDKIEKLLDQTKSCAIVSIVPDNHDPDLMVDIPNPWFWSRAREWRDKGLVVGLHGYQHACDTFGESLVPLHTTGEFLSEDFAIQFEKLSKAMDIFTRERMPTHVWVAPRHAFNQVTLEVLKTHQITTISDGFGFRPVLDALGFTWVPQQLWGPRAPWFGTWTICLHPNTMTEQGLDELANHMNRFRQYSSGGLFWNIVKGAKPKNALDRLAEVVFMKRIEYKRAISR